MRILKRKGSGRFRPDEEVRLLHTGGTPQTELLEFRHVGFVIGIPITHVLFIFRKIRLNDARDAAGCGRRNEARSKYLQREKNHEYGGDNRQPAFPFFWWTRKNPDEERIKCSHDKGHAVNSGDRGELDERRISGGGVSEQSPGKTDLRKIRSKYLGRNP